jgi:hypothetical protein
MQLIFSLLSKDAELWQFSQFWVQKNIKNTTLNRASIQKQVEQLLVISSCFKCDKFINMRDMI